MRPKIDITGRKYGRLTVIKSLGNKNKISLWLCKCLCGNERTISYGNLSVGHSKSCGCLQKERTSKANFKHGFSTKRNKTAEYRAWGGMISRCYDKNNKDYKNYGDRGILVCEKWKNSFLLFLKEMGEKPKETSIDRIDVNGHYCKKNCRWADIYQQARNKRNSIKLTYNGKTLSLSEWAKKSNLLTDTLRKRIKIHNWSIEKAINTPIKI